MTRHTSTIRTTGWFIGAVSAMMGLSCNAEPPRKPPSLLPDLRVARQAVEALWKSGVFLLRPKRPRRPVDR